ncbi:MAG: nuclear transport factor 2 family protein [Ginsengibacter sp.]
MLSRKKIENHFFTWLEAWNNHDIEGIMDFIHEEIEFTTWNGKIIAGKNSLKKFWTAWFFLHGNFKFTMEDFFLDEQHQKIIFAWQLKWPSLEKYYFGRKEIRQGVDILHLKEGKILKKNTYSKTFIHIDDQEISMKIL